MIGLNMKRKVGDQLYLNLLLDSGNNDLLNRVFVELRNSAGTLIKPVFEIFHVGSGDFRESSEIMPSNDTITAIYFVYQADGVTLDSFFSVVKDVYMRDFEGEIIADTLDAKISSIDRASMEGTIEDNVVLVGEVPTTEILEASLLDIEILEGTIEEEVTI